MRFETQAIHAGQDPDPTTGAVMTPIYQTSTFAQQGVGRHRGYEYARTGNPTRSALEACLAALEGGVHGLAFASGMAATDTVLRLLAPGDHVVAGRDVYGGTYRLFERVLKVYGLEFSYADTAQPKEVEAALKPNTRLVWLETPTNPLLRISDVRALADLVHRARPGAWLAVDNTFATPYLQRPLELGADLVIHSTTKYLGGHSDVVGGAVVVRSNELHERLAFLQNAVGAVPGPLDCFLVLRGIKTSRRAHGAPRAKRDGRGGVPGPSPTGRTRHVPVSRFTSATRPGAAADAQRRWNGVFHHARRREGCAAPRGAHSCIHPGGVAGRRGIADRNSSGHDPRLDRRFTD